MPPYAEVIMGLKEFAAHEALDRVTLHMSCALGDASMRPDVSKRQAALFEAARELIHMIDSERVAEAQSKPII